MNAESSFASLCQRIGKPTTQELMDRVIAAVERGRLPATEAEYDTADAEYLVAKHDLLAHLSDALGLPFDRVRELGGVL